MRDIPVSVLIPIHATAPEHLVWLEEAVESVRKQDYPRKTIMVLDDASPHTVNPGRLPDCTVLRNKERQGVCQSRNTLGAHCKTDWLLWLDADDRLYDGALAKMVDHAKPNLVIYGDLVVFGTGYAERYYPIADYDGCELLKRPIVPVTTLHTRRAFLEARGFDPTFEEGLEDWDYNIRLMLSGVCGENIKERTLWYRRHPGQRSKGAHWLRRMTHKVRDKYSGLRGEEMPCCGGGGRGMVRGRNPGNPRRASTSDASKTGDMVLVEYTGRKMGGFTRKGKATGQKYRFGGHDRQRWVWPADVRELVKMPGFRVVPRRTRPPEPDVVLLEKEAQLPIEPSPVSVSGGRPTRPDDLTQIKGLGASRQTGLAAIGLTRFEELAVADLALVAETAKVSLETAAEWIQEARERL